MPDIKQMFLDGREKGYERNRKNQREKDWRKGRKEAQVQVESIKILKKIKQTEKSEKTEKSEREELLRIEHLSVTFTQYDGWFSRKTLPVIRDLSLSVSRGEMVAVVGSSGSGKSLLAHAVMGVLPYNGSCGGDIYYKGKKLTEKRC